MECEKYLSLLGEYRDGELKEPVLSAVREHLSSCPSCREELEALETLSGILASIKAPQAPEGFENDVIRAMRNPRPRFSFPFYLRPVFSRRAAPVSGWRRPLAAFAALALLIAAGLFYGRRDASPDVSYAQLLISDAELSEFDSDAMAIFYGGI